MRNHVTAVQHCLAVSIALSALLTRPLVGQAQSTTTADSSARRDSVARNLAPRIIRAPRTSGNTFTAPLAVTHLSRAGFEYENGFALSDALNSVPGVLVQSRYGTSDVRMSIRGFGARGAGDRSNAGTSRGVRVLLDGFPETEPDGRTSFDHVDLGAIEGIDVIRSNASALWGNAAGGVVGLSTLPSISGRTISAQAMSGTYGLQRAILQAGTTFGTGGVMYATLVNTTFDGWRANSDARRVLFNGGVYAPVGENTTVRVHIVGANNLFHIPGPLSQAQVDADPQQANATYKTRIERRYNRLGRLGAAVEHNIAANQSLSVSMYVNPKSLQRSERGTYRDFTRYHLGGNAVYSAWGTLSTDVSHRFTAGLDQAYQDGAILFYGLTTAGTRATDLRDNKGEGAYNSGLFVEEELTVRDKVAFTVGARGDAISYYYKNFINPKVNASRRFERVSPKLGLSYKLSPTHVFYANLGGGVEVPAGNETDPAGTFGQDTVTALNPLLDPIRSTTFEVGTKQLFTPAATNGVLQAVQYDAALYLTNVTNDIVPYRGGRFYFTAGKVRRTGGELGATLRFRGGLSLEQAVTVSRNEYTEYVVDSVHYGKPGARADYSGNKAVGVPDFFANTNVVWSPSKAPLALAAQFGMQATGKYFADDANTVKVPGSNIMSAGVRADRLVSAGGMRLRGFLSIENLADKRFIGSAFLNPDVVGGVPIAFEPGMPRTVLLSFSISHSR